MEKYKKDLIDYLLIKKNKKRDFLIYTGSVTARLIRILGQVKDQFENFQDYSVSFRQNRYNETITFPIKVVDFTVSYKEQELVKYTFILGLDEPGIGLLLSCTITNLIHQQFDSELLKSFDTPPEWLTNCEHCTPFERNLGNADEFSEEKVAEFIVDTFTKMTQNFLI
ncbi:MAG: hypothetical protein NTU44_15320 [Bacteroidetes bacterium]|nr:hypothetical protein [Bacteroidota bacterium]